MWKSKVFQVRLRTRVNLFLIFKEGVMYVWAGSCPQLSALLFMPDLMELLFLVCDVFQAGQTGPVHCVLHRGCFSVSLMQVWKRGGGEKKSSPDSLGIIFSG